VSGAYVKYVKTIVPDAALLSDQHIRTWLAFFLSNLE